MYVAEELEGKLAPKGSTIFKSEPFVHVIMDEFKGKYCEQCFSNESESRKLLRCAVCKTTFYCGRECQKKAWIIHKFECKNMSASQQLDERLRLLAKLIFKIKVGGSDVQEKISSTGSRNISNLTSSTKHKTPHLKKPRVRGAFEEFVGKENMPNKKTLYDLYGKIEINEITITDYAWHKLGKGLYLSVSSLDHSCAPNACVTFHGCTCVIRLTEDVQNFEANKVPISYITSLLATTKRRREKLEKLFFFVCNCSRCIDRSFHNLERSAKCHTVGCDHPVKVSGSKIGPCGGCGYDGFTKKDLKCFQELEERAANLLYDPNTRRDNPSTYERLLYELQTTFHPLNMDYTCVLCSAIASGRGTEDLVQEITFARAFMPGIRKYMGNFNIYVAGILLGVAAKETYLGFLEIARRTYIEAKEILMMMHGRDHPAFKRGAPLEFLLEENLHHHLRTSAQAHQVASLLNVPYFLVKGALFGEFDMK